MLIKGYHLFLSFINTLLKVLSQELRAFIGRVQLSFLGLEVSDVIENEEAAVAHHLLIGVGANRHPIHNSYR